MRRRRLDPQATVSVFKVALSGQKSIWRRIAIRSDQTLDDLHAVIFTAFNRFDEHLYSFHRQPRYRMRVDEGDAGRIEYTSPVMIEDARSYLDHQIRDASQTRIDDLELTPGAKLYYVFDFGDNWWHDLVVEETNQPVESGRRYPAILERQGAAPPQYPSVEE
jgi:hypothetical protein